jgi:Transposase DDE domain/Transposase domain (DUF772)
MIKVSNLYQSAHTMNAIKAQQIMQRWTVVQHELIPMWHAEHELLTPKLEQLIHILEWLRLEEMCRDSWCGNGRPPYARAWFANAYIAKAVLGISTTIGLIERLTNDRPLRRICGFAMCKRLPSEATFSRAFGEFAKQELAQQWHRQFIKTQLGEELIGHICRDGTAIEAREKPAKADKNASEKGAQPKKRGRPRRDEVREPAPESPLVKQRKQTLAQMLEDIPRQCNRGTKCNAQGYKSSWTGYKLHIDTACNGVPVAAILSSASMHDSRAAIPLSLMTQERVTNLYDLMDAAYCSNELQEQSRELGHVPLIDHNPRGGVKQEFEPTDQIRYRHRTVAERTNARLKDEFGGRNVRVKGAAKVETHLTFGLLALSADQWARLRRQ